jgi:hypothetical protein
MTILVAYCTYLIVQKWLRPRFMLWGRRLFEAEVVVTLILQAILFGTVYLLAGYDPSFTMLYGIGFLLPGVMAHDMGRQKASTTIGAAGICLLIVFGLVTLIGAIRDLIGLPVSSLQGLRPALLQAYAYPNEWLLGGIFVSALASIAFYHRGRFSRRLSADPMRTAGFVSAGYLALFVNQPLNLLFVLVCSGLTYLIVTQYLMKQAILFGRAKLSAMFLSAVLTTWSAELLIAGSGLAFVPWRGFNAITPTIVALLANDAQRVGPKRALIGTTLATGVVFVTMSLIKIGYNLLSGGSSS